ncbi:hypothetical protein LINGRAPRIM_LOCUS1829 [Linum grandiflorum]
MQFKELCSRQWEVHFSHIYREANNVADYLANHATLSLIVCAFFIHQIGIYPIRYIMIL